MAPSSGAASAAAAVWGPRPQSRFGSSGAQAWAMAAREAWCSSGLGGLWAPWRCRRRRFSWRWARAMGNSCVTGSSSSSDHGQSLKSNGARAIDNSCVTGSLSHNFHATSRVSGSSCMTPLATLKDQSSGFLVKVSCVFGIQFIKVVVVKSNDVSETLFFQKISNICSDPQVYNWNIDDFFALKNPSTSPEFELCGHKWFITIYPSGNDKNGNHLSLYLRMKVSDTLHHDSANLAEISISIKDQETGKHRKSSEINNIWKMTWFTGPEPEQEGA